MSLEVHDTNVIRNRKKDKWQKRISRIVIYLLTASIMVGLFYMCHKLTEVIHHKENTIFFSGKAGGYIVLIVFLILFGLIVAWTFFTIKHHIVHRSISEIKGNIKIQMYIFGVLFILMLPFLVLGFDHYVGVSDKNVYESRFWTLGEKEYSWEEDISYISLHYNRSARTKSSSGSVSYKYIIHFTDGHRVDVWADVWDGSIDDIQLIDDVAQRYHIPFEVESRPSEEKIVDAFKGKNLEFAKELFSR